MQQPKAPQKIVVLNTKGGSGKTTVATNLAAYYAWRGSRVALMDLAEGEKLVAIAQLAESDEAAAAE